MPETLKRTIIARSHYYAGASDCIIYLRGKFIKLRNVPFAVEPDLGESFNMWKLIVCCDLDRIKGEIDIDFTNLIVAVARAYITGRGGLPLPTHDVTS